MKYEGANQERLSKSKIKAAPRLLTSGGVTVEWGHHDEEHCALDHLLNGGYIETHHYDAGYELRGLYYAFTATGRWIDEGGKGYDGDVMTSKDYAEERYRKAMASISSAYRDITRYACVEGSQKIPARYGVIPDIMNGLEELYIFFQKGVDL